MQVGRVEIVNQCVACGANLNSDRASFCGTACARKWEIEARWRRDFANAWLDIGRPFFKCVYCSGSRTRPEYHFTHVDEKTGKPAPGVPVCDPEKFVRGLIYKFPMLRRDTPGLTPWDPNKWARWWRTSGALTGGSRHAVAFVLSLWAGGNSDYWRRRGFSFDAVAAFGSWDDAHREAFMRWCRNPWRP